MLNSLKAGRIYFGNPKSWKGIFAFQVDDAYMGDQIPNPGNKSLLQFQLDPWPDSVDVYLVQGLIKPGMELEYLHDRTPLNRNQAIELDTSRASFVRLEAYEELGDGEKIAIFTNPVTMLPNPGSVQGRVFEDLNNDGVFSDGEPPLSGARLILRSTGLNQRFEADGDDIFINAWTNDSGTYSFTELLPDSYRVALIKDMESTFPSDAILTSEVNPYQFTLADGENLSALDFGYMHPQESEDSNIQDIPENDTDEPPGSTNVDSNGDGLSDIDAMALRLDPGDPDGDTDGDGISDIQELGPDTSKPFDNDLDGLIDALEPGSSAMDAGTVSGLPLPSGDSVTITVPVGYALSEAKSESMADVPSGFNFLFGAISYTTSSPVGGSLVARMAFSIDLPNDLALYKMDATGVLSKLPNSIWTQTDSRTVHVTLKDGDPTTDLDSTVNGFIVDPIVLSSAPPSQAVSGADGEASGGGGGCMLTTQHRIDPSLMLLLFALVAYRIKRYINAKIIRTSMKLSG
jgi:hypothetical protein